MATYYLSPLGNDSNLGTSRGPSGAWRNLSKAASVLAAGDTVYILGVAGNSASYPTTGLDYTVTGYFTPTNNGTVAAGYVRWLRDPTGPIPTIGCPGLTFYGPKMHWFSELYFVATGNGANSYGIFSGEQCVIEKCTVNVNSQVGQVGIHFSGGMIKECEIYGGTLSPTFNSGSYLVVVESYTTLVINNWIHHGRDVGIYQTTAGHGTQIFGNRIIGCAGDGIQTNSNGANLSVDTTINGNTIHNNKGNGITVNAVGGITYVYIINNIITNHTGVGKSGIFVSDGSTSLNDIRKTIVNYNDVYNNTSNYTNISSGTSDINIDPQYANSATNDYTPTNPSLQVGYP